MILQSEKFSVTLIASVIIIVLKTNARKWQSSLNDDANE